MALKSLNELLIHFLRDVLYAEKHGAKVMRQMARKAEAEELKMLILSHLDETDTQLDNLQKALENLNMTARGVRCEAMDGIIDETKELMEEAKNGSVRDAAIIAAAQAMKHYEITRYGTIAAWAKQLGHKEIAELAAENLKSDEAADKALTKLAERQLNAAADKLAA